MGVYCFFDGFCCIYMRIYKTLAIVWLFLFVFAGKPGFSGGLELFPHVYTNILEQKRFAGQEKNIIIFKIF